MGFLQSIFKRARREPYLEKRGRSRLNCSIATEFNDVKGKTWSCRIVDMSENGFGIATSAHLRIGNTINMMRPSVEARVVWATESRAGLRIIT
ncbi:MAG TPA: PilZ domain-containing protein [Dissulfurispiraceae bacterium]|nr:PilZ domain-containing protein [Dissulfurispiraceae bacterium]